MSKYDIIHATQVEMIELSDEAMESVAGGGFTLIISGGSKIEDFIIVNESNRFQLAVNSDGSNIVNGTV